MSLDGRNELEPITVNDNDIFVGTRFALNDIQDTALLAGVAYDVDTGDVLWETRLASTVEGFPVTYEIDGVQYFGIPTGRGGGSPWRIGDFLTPELVSPGGHNALYVFRLAEP